MAGAFLEIRVDDAEIRRGLQRLETKLGNLKPFFQDIGEALLNSTRERFTTQTDPTGRQWKDYAPLSPAYARVKKQNVAQILTLYGRLGGTLNSQAEPDALRIGTPLIYGATHQFGDPRRNIPARPFLGLSDTDTAMILAALEDWLSRDD